MERRRAERKEIAAPGAFLQDGNIYKVRLRDVSASGVGAYLDAELKPGVEGILFAPVDHSGKVKEIPTEICWCMADPLAEDDSLPYRAGFRIMGSGTT